MYLQTTGLVLREVEYNDSDKLLTVLTPDYGKLTLKARGVRKNTSPIKAACQLLCYASFTVGSYRNHYTITEAEPVEMFTGLRDDLELLSLGSWFAQAAQTVSDTDVPTPALLQLLLYALYGLVRGKPQKLVKAAYELRLVSQAGFMPDLSACAVCGNETPDGFDVERGRLCCLACRGPEQGICMPVDESALAALRYIVEAPLDRLFSFRLPEASLEQLSQGAETYLMTQLQRSFSALDFYKALLLPGLGPHGTA